MVFSVHIFQLDMTLQTKLAKLPNLWTIMQIWKLKEPNRGLSDTWETKSEFIPNENKVQQIVLHRNQGRKKHFRNNLQVNPNERKNSATRAG